MKSVRPVWKPVKEFAPFCPECNEQLSGDNSIALPYTCECGVWESSDWSKPLDFIIKKHEPANSNNL